MLLLGLYIATPILTIVEQNNPVMPAGAVRVTKRVAYKTIYALFTIRFFFAIFSRCVQNCDCCGSCFCVALYNIAVLFCFLGLHNFAQAKNYLAQSKWIILQDSSCPDSIRHRLFRTEGIIYASKRMFDEARRAFADDVSMTLVKMKSIDSRLHMCCTYTA